MTNNILRLADELKLPSRDRYVVRNKDSADVNSAIVSAWVILLYVCLYTVYV